MSIGETIYKYRKQAGLSQEELAYKMNITRQSVSLWETDQTVPSLESLKLLSEIFAVSLDELCGSPAKVVEAAPPQTPKKEESLVCVQTKYTPELVKRINRISAAKFYIIYIVAIILSVFMGISIILSDTDNAALIIPIFLVILFAALLIRISFLLKKRTAEFFELCPNGVVTVNFFQDYFEIESTSDNTNSKATIRYSDIKKVINAEKCILIYYGNTVVPIEKNQPDTNYDLVLKLLNVSSDKRASQNNKIKALLLTMFVLSLLSIFMALFAVAISVSLSPLPDFPFNMPERMWVFFIFIPLPLASAVLGFIFLAKNYKCKKNIIAGIIMCALLAIYGSFTFIFADSTLHDFGYVHELEQIVSIDLPDSGYISRAINTDSTTNSFAMIKFDDANEISDIVSNDKRFASNMNSIPANFIDMYYTTITSDYHYFMIFDVTSNKVNVIPNSQSGEHRFLFIAYNKDKNILFVLDFMK